MSNFSLHLFISLGLLLTLPKDSAGVGDVKENSQKAEIKLQMHYSGLLGGFRLLGDSLSGVAR